MSGTFSRLKRKVGFLSRCLKGKGPHHTLRGESPRFSRVVAANLRILSSYDQDFRNPLLWPQESPVSLRVERDLSGFLSSRCQGHGPHLELRPEPQGSSPVPTWISGSSGVSAGESGLVSCGDMQVCFSLELEKQCQASCRVDLGIGGFLSRCLRAVTHAIVF